MWVNLNDSLTILSKKFNIHLKVSGEKQYRLSYVLQVYKVYSLLVKAQTAGAHCQNVSFNRFGVETESVNFSQTVRDADAADLGSNLMNTGLV